MFKSSSFSEIKMFLSFMAAVIVHQLFGDMSAFAFIALVECMHYAFQYWRSGAYLDTILAKIIRIYGRTIVLAVIALILFSAFTTSVGRVVFMKTMATSPTLIRIVGCHIFFTLSNSLLTSFMSSFHVGPIVVGLMYDMLFSVIRNLRRRVEKDEDATKRDILKNRHNVQEFLGAVVSLMTFIVTMIITLIATDDLSVIVIIVFVNVITSTMMFMFPYAKALQIQPMDRICVCRRYCAGQCGVKKYIPAKCRELFWTFVYSCAQEIACIVFIYTLPNSSSLIQTYVAIAWMQRQAVASFMSLKHGHHVHDLLDLILEFSKSQRPSDGCNNLDNITQIKLDGYSVYQQSKRLITNLTYVFNAGHMYWITGNNGVGKTTLLRSMHYMLKGMDVMCGGVLIPVTEATIGSVEAQFSYLHDDGPLGTFRLNKPALFAKWSKYAFMLGLTQKQADSHNHSDGELQKWLLLYALDTCGSVLILDELLSAITVDIRHIVIFNLLPEFAKKTGKIVLLVAHCDGDISVPNLHRLVLEHSGNTTLT